MSWTCQRCQLPDLHHGDGDGIGSCDCSRCDCCGAAPYDCECSRDFDEMYDDPDEPWDYLCNDSACVWLQARLKAKAEAGELRRRADEVES